VYESRSYLQAGETADISRPMVKKRLGEAFFRGARETAMVAPAGD
jgi:hypothetical protein